MTLNHKELKNKILGCFNGKNAGGVLGAPFEQLPRGTNDVKFYVQENLNCNPPPTTTSTFSSFGSLPQKDTAHR